MPEVYLLDGAAETALSSRETGLFPALLANTKPSGTVTRFDTSKIPFHAAACIEFGTGERREAENLTQTLLRRVLPRFRRFPDVRTIIWAGVKGNAEFIEQGGWTSEPGRGFPHLPRHYTSWIRDQLGFREAKLIEVQAACASSAVGLAVAADLIVSGISPSVLVIAADIVSRFSFMGFGALNALTADVCRPFDIRRNGLLLGDGAGAVLLGGEDYVSVTGLTPRARLSGWGVASDAFHITAPAPDGRGLVSAIRRALEKARSEPRDIAAFCAHGTGTVYNDAMELRAIDTVFGRRPFPVFSVKGAVGHTLGAAGAIEALLCADALDEGVVPPTTGCEQPEARGVGRISEERQEFDGRRVMTTNSGFGGINAALIFEKADGR
jgi:3-oxoacyl-[acyl-carrier-protein] synthase II